MAAADLWAIVVSVAVLVALWKINIGTKLRRMVTRKRMASVGGFGLGMFFGPAVFAAVGGFFSSVLGISLTNVGGLTNISMETMLTVAVVIGAVILFFRMGDD